HVGPGDALRDEAAEEASRKDMISLALHAALKYVGDLALEIGVIVRVEREIPDAFAARAARFDQFVRERGSIRQDAAHALGERVDTGAGQSGKVEHETRLRTPSQGERVGQHHPAL